MNEGPVAADGRVYTWRIRARAVAPVVVENLHTLADDKQFTARFAMIQGLAALARVREQSARRCHWA